MIPTVSVDQMREVDRLMVEEMGIVLLQMMENAGRTLAEQARRMLAGDVSERRIVVLAGRGGNGGGGLAAARRLAIWGADVSVSLGQARERITDVPAQQLGILEQIGVAVHGPEATDGLADALRTADLVLDALIGYSLRAPPREPIAAFIRAANSSGARVLALDIPSGMDGDTGEAYDPTIRATATLTLALPKAGLLLPRARGWVGELFLADISVPEAVYRRIGLRVGPLFARADIVPVAPMDASKSLGGSSRKRPGTH